MSRNCSRSKKENHSISRRRFIHATAVAAGAATLGSPAIVCGQNLNDRLNIAIIGAGGRGRGNLQSVSSENIVALSDVNGNNLDDLAAKYPKARRISDFRKLYDYSH